MLISLGLYRDLHSLSSADSPWIWLLPCLGGSNAIQGSLPQFHAMGGEVLRRGTLLSHVASLQWLPGIMEGSMTPLLMIAFITLKPMPCGRHCQDGLPVWAGLWLLETHLQLLLFVVLF